MLLTPDAISRKGTALVAKPQLLDGISFSKTALCATRKFQEPQHTLSGLALRNMAYHVIPKDKRVAQHGIAKPKDSAQPWARERQSGMQSTPCKQQRLKLVTKILKQTERGRRARHGRDNRVSMQQHTPEEAKIGGGKQIWMNIWHAWYAVGQQGT
eukprot:scaffold249142_cov18-Tisochrysis_lutea.AAC.1